MDLKVGTISATVALILSPLKAGLAEAKSNVKAFSTSLKGDLESVENRSAQMSAKVKSSINTISNAFLAGGTVIAAGLGAAAKASLDFNKELANVDSIAKLTGEQMKKLHDDVLSLAADPQIRQGPVDLAKALYDINSSGFSGDAALKILKQSAYGASAGMSDTATSAKALTAVLNSQIGGVTDAKQAMDVLFKIVDRGVITFPELSNGIGAVLANARVAGVSIQEVGAYIAVATKQGQSGADALNDLNNILSKILNPGNDNVKFWKQLGIEYGTSAIKAKGLGGVIADIVEKTNGNADALRKLFPDLQAFRGVAVAGTNGAKGFRTELEQMGHATDGVGSSQAALERQNKSGAAQLEILKKELEIAAVEAGDSLAPAIESVTKAVRNAVKWWRDLGDEAKQSHVKAAVWVGGGLLIAGSIGKIIVVAAELKGAFVALGITANATWLSMLGPIALVAAAIGGLAAIAREAFVNVPRIINEGRQAAWTNNVRSAATDPNFIAAQIRDRESANARHRQTIADPASDARARYEAQQSIRSNEEWIRQQKARIETMGAGRFSSAATVGAQGGAGGAGSVTNPNVNPLAGFDPKAGKKAASDAKREHEEMFREMQAKAEEKARAVADTIESIFKLTHDEITNQRHQALKQFEDRRESGVPFDTALRELVLENQRIDGELREARQKRLQEQNASAQESLQSWINGLSATVEATREQVEKRNEVIKKANEEAARVSADIGRALSAGLGSYLPDVKAIEEEVARVRYELNHRDYQDYLNILLKKIAGLRIYSEEWKRVYQEIQDIQEQTTEKATPEKELTNWQKALKSIADSTRGIFEGVFEDLFEHGFKNFFQNILKGFQQLIAQLIAKWVASQIVRLIFGATLGGGGGFLGGIFGFDDAGNDATARRWGFDFADHFSRGISNFHTARLQPAAALAGGGSGNGAFSPVIHVNFHDTTIHRDVDIDRLGERLAYVTAEKLRGSRFGTGS